MVDTIAGRYELAEPLGAGGMARVVAARDVRLDRRVAIKLVDAASVDPVVRQRFVREAQSSARFSHPNAVAVYDAGAADGSLFLVMELVEGPSLAAELRNGPLPTDRAVSIADEVLAALGAAHAAGIVHRDVKPGNILLGPDGAKLADFGIAKRLDDLTGDLTSAGQFVGTPKYLAPEQVMGELATGATDLYSVGVVLFEMVTGAPPFDSSTPVATAIAHRDRPIPDVRAAAPAGLPAHVASTIERAMAKDPAARFASAAEMRAALTGAAVPAPLGPLAAGVAAVAGQPTQHYPHPDGAAAAPVVALAGDGASPAPRRPWWLLAVAALIAVALGVVATALAGGDDDDGLAGETVLSSGVASTVAPETVPAEVAVVTTAVPSPTPTPAAAPAPTQAATPAPPAPTPAPTAPRLIVPTNLGDLSSLFGANPASFGEAGQELAEALAEIEERNGRQQSKRAAELLEQIDQWVSDGQLSPEVPALVLPLLGPIADGPGGGDEDDGDDGDD